ncbi:uncharacterized protein Bfra_000934 [Botrytis fragariae]|uniref:Uncharacterized protein n=1 Tax=Botrytis fragariae TaxID=1964551 RepID=A0A8H6B438_9HELO|nr:uncharacterized protein Bfra_000934 [Botrytis fragariae]KAF5878765.1 hypothetical protein Bfra_000934 [Botrytis fragariae]
MSAHVPVGNIDYNLWFKDQQYSPGAYPTIDTLPFLCRQDAAIYNAKIRFQQETMRVHETIAPTTATAYDITDLSRHVFGYWEMMLGIAKADPVWAASYGRINTPRSFNSSWSHAKQHIRELIIKNQRAADSAATQAAADAVDGVEEVDDEGEEGSDEESIGSVIVVEYNNDGEEGNDGGIDEDNEGEDSDEEMDGSVIVVEYNDDEEEGYDGEMDEEDEEDEDSDGEIVGFWWDNTGASSVVLKFFQKANIYHSKLGIDCFFNHVIGCQLELPDL